MRHHEPSGRVSAHGSRGHHTRWHRTRERTSRSDTRSRRSHHRLLAGLHAGLHHRLLAGLHHRVGQHRHWSLYLRVRTCGWCTASLWRLRRYALRTSRQRRSNRSRAFLAIAVPTFLARLLHRWVRARSMRGLLLLLLLLLWQRRWRWWRYSSRTSVRWWRWQWRRCGGRRERLGVCVEARLGRRWRLRHDGATAAAALFVATVIVVFTFPFLVLTDLVGVRRNRRGGSRNRNLRLLGGWCGGEGGRLRGCRRARRLRWFLSHRSSDRHSLCVYIYIYIIFKGPYFFFFCGGGLFPCFVFC